MLITISFKHRKLYQQCCTDADHYLSFKQHIIQNLLDNALLGLGLGLGSSSTIQVHVKTLQKLYKMHYYIPKTDQIFHLKIQKPNIFVNFVFQRLHVQTQINKLIIFVNNLFLFQKKFVYADGIFVTKR